MKWLSAILTLAVIVWSSHSYAQYDPNGAPDVASEISSTIKGDDLIGYLNILASDDYEGRETGYPGNQKAAEFIAGKFAEFGIPPIESLDGYFQQLTFSRVKFEDASLTIRGNAYDNMKDFVVIPTMMPQDEVTLAAEELIFLGYGVDDAVYSDYANAPDLNGASILIYGGEPVDGDGNSLITGTSDFSDWTYEFEKKLKAARERGVANVLVISNNFRALAGSQRRMILTGHTIMGAVEDRPDLAAHWVISSTTAELIMDKKTRKVIKSRDKIARKGKLKPVTVPVEISGIQQRAIDATTGANVLGYIEGIDPSMKDEVVVVTAHYDHVGTRGNEVFNGADDNASGTSGVMEIAEAFQIAKDKGYGPRRSVLCMLVTGEEKGLLGSQYYSEFPVFPLENTVANVNMDMIGRIDNEHDHPNYVYVIGSDKLSSELHEINETANTTYTKLELDYTYNADDDPNMFYYRSDHYNFAKNGIPVVFYFDGIHDDYHRPTDTADKILPDRAATVARLAFHVTWELANREKKISVDVKN